MTSPEENREAIRRRARFLADAMPPISGEEQARLRELLRPRRRRSGATSN